MFVDVCFPSKNEQEFLKVASKLNTKALCFVYKDKKEIEKINHPEIKTFVALESENIIKSKDIAFFLQPLTKDIKKNKKQHYYFPDIYKKNSFHYPIREINQVVIKKLHDREKFLGIPFSEILNGNPQIIEKVCFIVKLCRKYKVKIFLASFAKNPYELRAEKDLRALTRFICMDTKTAKDALHNLSSLLDWFP